jgi:aminomethyltransferase
VRVYGEQSGFQRSSGRRVSASRPVKMTEETAFTRRIRALTDDLTDSGGFWLPNSYAASGEIAEYWALRQRAALMDLSSLRKFEVYGPDAARLLQTAFSRDITSMAIGQAMYGCLLNTHGGIVNDGIAFRLAEDSFRYVGNCETDGDWLRGIARERGLEVFVKSSSVLWHNLALQGPRSRAILGSLLTFDPQWGVTALEELRAFRFAMGHVGDISVMISRTGYTGELGYELFVHPQEGAALWDLLRNAGEPHGLTPLGLKALDRARIEAGLLSPGREFDPGVSPFQAGIGWAVALGKDEFVGKAACERLRAYPPRIAVGLTLTGNEVAPVGEHVYAPDDLFPAGRITSATFSPVLNKSIALAQVFPEYGSHGTRLEVGFVDGLARRVEAIVGPLAAYDRKRRGKP